MALALISAVPRLGGDPSGPADPSWARDALVFVGLAGFVLGMVALWLAVERWLRDELGRAARWAGALGFGAVLVAVIFAP